jgi:hypothetical protein
VDVLTTNDAILLTQRDEQQPGAPTTRDDRSPDHPDRRPSWPVISWIMICLME